MAMEFDLSLDNKDIERKLAETRQNLYRPLTDIAAHVPIVDGIEFGLPYLDNITGGLKTRKLNIVAGYSHHGKTTLMLTCLVHNLEDFPCLFISGDDTDDTVLGKIIAMKEHMSTDEVERAGPEWRTRYVKENLNGKMMLAAVKDEYSIAEVEWLYEEACEELGQSPAIACFDYASMLRLRMDREEAFHQIKDKFNHLKRLFRKLDETVWMVGHQCRKSAEDTNALTLNDLEYGGHQQADGVIIGCRKRGPASMREEELLEEETAPKVWLSVMKNKINGKKSSNPVGARHVIDPTSGIIREELDSDKPPRALPHTNGYASSYRVK